MEKTVLKDMMDNLLHIGNKKQYWHPVMKDNIYWTINGIHVFDLVNTYNKLEEVKKILFNLSREWKKILFVWTKVQAKNAVVTMAEENGHYYVDEKWVPGLLTNFKTIRRRIQSYIQLSEDSKSWELEKLTKQEAASKRVELFKLDRAYKWVKEMKRAPDAIFVIDGRYEDAVLIEAKSMKIPVYWILNTNANSDMVENFIPANTNSIKSLDFISKYIWKLPASEKKAPKHNIVNKMYKKPVAPVAPKVQNEKKVDDNKTVEKK